MRVSKQILELYVNGLNVNETSQITFRRVHNPAETLLTVPRPSVRPLTRK